MLFVLVATAGCDRVFALIEVPPDAAVRPVDTRTDDATPDADDDGCFVDDFSAASIDSSHWPVVDEPFAAKVDQSGGLLSFTLVNTTVYAYARVGTEVRDLTNDAIEVELVELPNVNTKAELGLTAGLDLNNRYTYFVRNGFLATRATVAGTNFDMEREVTGADRYVRIRFTPGQVTWEASADHVNWVTERMEPTAVPVTAVVIGLFAGTFQAEAAPGTPKLDNFALICLP